MVTTSDRGETTQLATESNLSWLQAAKRKGRRLDSRATRCNQRTWKNIFYLFSLSFPSLSFSRPQNPPFVLVLLVVEVIHPKWTPFL